MNKLFLTFFMLFACLSLSAQLTVTFDDPPETPFDELPAMMYFTFSEEQQGVPPTVYIKSDNYEKKVQCMRDGSNYARYYAWVSYYVKDDLLAEIQETGEFKFCITLNDGTVLDPVVFKLKKPLTVTFDNDPETPLDELPASMYFTFSEEQKGVPPTVYIKSDNYEKKVVVSRDGSNYARYYAWVSYYVKDDLLAEIQETGEFKFCITLNDGTELDPVVFKLKKPLTVTFDNDPETPLDELPASMYFTFSEEQKGVPPTVYIKSDNYEKKVVVSRDGSNYARYYAWVSYYVKDDLLAEIQETGEFKFCITLNDGTELDPVVFKLKKADEPYTATFAAANGSIFAGMPEKINFTLSKDAPADVIVKAKVNGIREISCQRNGESAREFFIAGENINADEYASGQFALAVYVADAEEAAAEVSYFTVPAEFSWTPAQGNEDGSVFSSLPSSLAYTLSSVLPEGGSVGTGIMLSDAEKAEWDVTVPCTIDGTAVNFDTKSISGDDLARIEQNETFTVALRLANKTLTASYTLKPRKGSITLGYCTDDLSENMQKLGSEGAATTVGAAIRIPAAKLEALKGGTITKIRFAMDEGLERVYAWIRPSLSKPAICLKKVETTGKGWHEVELDEPYTITGDEIFIGYSGHQPQGIKAILAGGSDRPDACWLGIKEAWEDRSNKGYGSLYIQAIGEATLPATDLGVDNLSLDNKYYKTDETAKASFAIINSGADEVKGYTINWKIDDAEPQTITVNEALASDSRSEHSLDLPVEGLSDGIHTLTVACEVTDNGRQDQIADNNSATATIAVYTDSYKRTVLLEQFTTINCHNCPKGSAVLKAATEGRDNVAWLAHHVGYGVDEFTVEGSADLLDFEVPGAPSLMIDRTLVEGANPPFGIGFSNTTAGAELVGSYIDRCAAEPSFAGLTVTNEFNEETRELSVSVTIERNAIFSTFFPDCNYSLFLTEDNLIGKTSQAGATGEYIHNHVVRLFLTPSFGTPVEWADDSFTTTASTVLDASWKAWNMNVVAVLNKPFDASDTANGQVLNAAVSKVNAVSSISDITGDSFGIRVNADGSISADSLSSIEVYTPSGLHVVNRNLAKGLYIVRATSAAGENIVAKIQVK